jgi:DnaJ-class molecular chaperone
MHIDELFKQKKIQINFERFKKCDCVSKPTDCSRCKGKGYTTDLRVCTSCRTNSCKICNDAIITKEKMSVSWSPSKFFKNGQTQKYANMGNYDFEKEKFRDATIKLNIITDNALTISGSSVESTEIIPLTKLVLGGKIEINTIRGKKEIKLSRGMQTDDYKIIDKIVNNVNIRDCRLGIIMMRMSK